MSNVKNMRDYEQDLVDPHDNPVDLTAYLDILVRYRWTFLSIVLTGVVIGLIYAMVAKPVYRADILVQVEEPNPASGATKMAASVSPVFDVKPAAAAEIELLRSRMVVGKAVDSLQLNLVASPRYFPGIGSAVAGFNRELSKPGLFGMGGSWAASHGAANRSRWRGSKFRRPWTAARYWSRRWATTSTVCRSPATMPRARACWARR